MNKLIIVFLLCACNSMAQRQFSFEEDKDKKEVKIFYGGKLVTAYCYYDSSRKPILFPVNTLEGITVTRSYPFSMVAGERTDHPHHTGIWLNYESVNGLDFWNNSTAIPVEKRDHYGTIVHKSVAARVSVAGILMYLDAEADWVRPDKKVLLKEKTHYSFSRNGRTLIIDRTTTLTATDTTVTFKDVKDGMLAIRVARELELPSKEKSKFVDDKGNVTEVAPSGNEVTGMYYASNGAKGDSAWGTKGNWMMLTGKKEGKDITIGMLDHPSNPGYPTYWHARGYGLFALNPLGRKVFSNGKEEMNLTLQPGKSVTFRYWIAIASEKLSVDNMNKLAEFFAKRK